MFELIFCGIYRIRNTANGKVYVGSAVNVSRRWALHRFLLNRGDHHCQHLQRAWVKHGETAFVFEIIEAIEGKDGLMRREQAHMDTLRAADHGIYNTAMQATSCLGIKRSAETRAKQSASLRGKKRTEATIAKLRAASLGKKHTAEAKAKVSAANKGKTFTAETRAKISVAKKGWKWPPGMLEKQRAKTCSPEERIKISARNKGRKLITKPGQPRYRGPRPPMSDKTRAALAAANKARWSRIKSGLHTAISVPSISLPQPTVGVSCQS